MRPLLASALVLAACGGSDRPSLPPGAGASAPIPAGPDPLVVRLPRDGGRLAAWGYPALDSLVWRASAGARGVARVLAADLDDGYLAAVDTAGRPVRIDLRLGAVAIPGEAGGRLHASADGANLFALNAEGRVARYTPVGDRWTFAPRSAVHALVPTAEGSLVLVGAEGERTRLLRVRPPDSALVDSLVLEAAADPAVLAATARARGDRLFLAAGTHAVSVRLRDFVADLDVDVDAPIRLLTATPSGDRLFVHAGDEAELLVIDRFAGEVSATVRLPAVPRALRVDPLGRTLLAQAPDDSVWVVDVGSGALLATIASDWRDDLPAVLADARIARLQGEDVIVGPPLAPADSLTRIARGGRDTWYAMRWNGFRPRAAGLDAPRRFPRGGDARPDGDAVAAGGANADAAAPTTDPPPGADATSPATGSGAATRGDSAGASPAAGSTAPAPAGWSIQFAAVLSEADARAAAEGFTVEGLVPRIVTAERGGRTLWRVVLGPFASREEADRIGRASGRTYWVFEGAP